MRRLPGLHALTLLLFLLHFVGLWVYGVALGHWPVGTAIIYALLLFVLARYWPEEGER